MAHFVMLDAEALVDGSRLTCRTNQISLATTAQVKDATTFCDPWEQKVAGRRSSSVNIAGFADYSDASVPSLNTEEALGNTGHGNNRLVTVGPTAPVAGTGIAYSSMMVQGAYEQFGESGELTPFNVPFSGSSPLVRGRWSDVGEARTAAWTSTGVNLGAVSSAQRLYVAIHLIRRTGSSSPSVTPTIQSDDNAGFTSPSTVATGSPITSTSGVWLSVVGPITDTYFRISWAVVGSSPTFQVYSTIGIGPL